MDLRSMSVINVSISKIQKITVILCFYVDDIFIVNSDDKMVTSTKKLLNLKFDMKDMRLVDVILEIKITRTSDGIILNQSYYMEMKDMGLVDVTLGIKITRTSDGISLNQSYYVEFFLRN